MVDREPMLTVSPDDRTYRMNDIIRSSMKWGGRYGSIAAFVTALIQSFLWGIDQQPIEFALLLIFWVPMLTIAGGVAAYVLFGLVGTVISFHPAGIAPSPFSYAFLGVLLALTIVVFPFGSWVAGSLLRALQGAQGTYYLIPTGLLPVAIAGSLTGAQVSRYEGV